jgi:hypothetical protein
MIERAAGDVGSLIKLCSMQSAKATSDQKSNASRITEENLEFIAAAETCHINVVNPGLFIGKGGANIQALRRETNTLMYQRDNKSGPWIVYYTNANSLKKVKAKAAEFGSRGCGTRWGGVHDDDDDD